MKAVLSRVPGPPETLVVEEVPDPIPGAGQALLDVKACGVNYPDVLLIEDRYQFKPPRPFTPGIEVAGVVAALGADTTTLRVGQRVLANLRYGGMAEKAVVDEAAAAVVPDAMPFDEAAALFTTYGTSLYALHDRGRLKAGETLLVLGAGGGVGLAAVELGKAMGARVVAAASSQAKLDLALDHGAHAGVLYPGGPLDKESARALAARLKEACEASGWDVACDSVGGDYAEAAVRASNWGGRYLVVGFTAGIPRLALSLVLLKSCEIVGVLSGAAMIRDPSIRTAKLSELFTLYRQGRIRPYVSAHFPLERAGDAIAELAERKALGKVVVVMS